MRTKLKLHNRIWSLLLTAALLFPAVSQLAHQLEGHEHVVCQDFSTHLHQSEFECPIQDFHLNSFDLGEQLVFSPLNSTTNSAPFLSPEGAELSNPHLAYLLRGPPALS